MAEELTTVTCKDCGNEFTLTAEEKAWYEEKGFELPKRCPDCRATRKQAQRERRSKE